MDADFTSRLDKLFAPNGRFAAAIKKHIELRRQELGSSFDFNREVFWFPSREHPSRRVADLIDEYVISELSAPLFFTQDDLLKTLHAQLGEANPTERFETAWNRVLAFTFGSVAGLFDESRTFALGAWGAPDRQPTAEDDDPALGYLWVSKCEHFMLDAEWNNNCAFARLHGSATPAAIDVAVAQMTDVCQMAANTVRLARSHDGTASFSKLADPIGRLLFRSCLESSLRPPKAKLSAIETAQQNSVHLLVESDKIVNDAISTSLSVAAVEALLCEGTAIAEQFSQRGAVLLESDRHKRAVATERLKKLYNERSRTLHGDGIGGSAQLRQTARRFASGVVAAVFQWQDHRRKAGDDAERRSLLGELKEVTMSGQAVVGIDPDLRACLPQTV